MIRLVLLLMVLGNVFLLIANKAKDFINRASYDFAITNIGSANINDLFSQFGNEKSYVRIYYRFIIRNFSGITGIKVSNIKITLRYKGVVIGKTPDSKSSSVNIKGFGDNNINGAVNIIMNSSTAAMLLELQLSNRVKVDYSANFTLFGFYSHTYKDSYEYINS